MALRRRLAGGGGKAEGEGEGEWQGGGGREGVGRKEEEMVAKEACRGG